MKHGLTRTSALALVCATLLLCACSGVNQWLFGGAQEQDLSRPPPGATAYQCEGGKRLFVRYLDNGAAAWVILPEREFRLNKSASTSGSRYSNGSATLDIKDSGATLSHGAEVTHANCKTSGG